MPNDENGSSLIYNLEAPSGTKSLRFRKGEKNDKDIFAELWTCDEGFKWSKKISDKVSKLYLDSVFGIP